jgi:hypothetical protein
VERNTLAGLGAVGLAEDAALAAAGGALAVWRSWPLSPARRLSAPVVDALVRRGERERPRLRSGASDAVERAVDELLHSGLIEAVADQVADSRLPAHLESSEALARAVDEAVDRVLASEQLHRVVSHIAESREVREALAAQPASMAGEVADAVRARTASADDVADRVARRLLHRRGARLTTDPG